MFHSVIFVAAIFVLTTNAQNDTDTVMNTTTPNMMVTDGVDTMSTSMPDTDAPKMSTTMKTDMGNTTPDDTPVSSTTAQMPVVTTTPNDVPCNDSIGRLKEIFDFTSTDVFTDMLSENEQIVVFEILAAAEGCKMAAFITPETAERIFRMLGSLPVRFVYIFINYMSEALANEGVVVPV